MFTYDFDPHLEKKLRLLKRKQPVLFSILTKKIREVIAHDINTISTYKNLKAPLQEFKRIHLTNTHILLFVVDLEEQKIIFIDIKHRDNAYKN